MIDIELHFISCLLLNYFPVTKNITTSCKWLC